MNIELSTIDDATVLTVGEKRLTAANVEAVRRQLIEAVGSPGRRSILDLGPVEFMDSSGAGLLVAIHKAVSRSGGQVRVAGLSGQPLMLVRLVNLDRILPISRDVGEALESMLGEGSGRFRALKEPAADEMRTVEGIERLMERLTLQYETQFGEIPDATASRIRQALEATLLGTPLEPEEEEDPAQREGSARMLARLAESLGHRLGGILGLLHGRVQFLRTLTQEEALRGSLDVMDRACRWGGEELRRFRSFSAGPRTALPERLPLRRVLDESIESARLVWEERSEGRGRTVRIIREFAGHPEVFANGERLRIAFQEILVNAAEAMPDGGILSLSLTQGGGDAVVSVSDTGRGIRSADGMKVFEPGFSGKGTPGAGLGLVLARHVVEGCGGKIQMESEEGRGTTVRIRLPNVSGRMLEESGRA